LNYARRLLTFFRQQFVRADDLYAKRQ